MPQHNNYVVINYVSIVTHYIIMKLWASSMSIVPMRLMHAIKFLSMHYTEIYLQFCIIKIHKT